MKCLPGQPHGAGFVATEFKVVSVQRLVMKSKNGDAHEEVMAGLGPKGLMRAMNPFVLYHLSRGLPFFLFQTINHLDLPHLQLPFADSNAACCIIPASLSTSSSFCRMIGKTARPK